MFKNFLKWITFVCCCLPMLATAQTITGVIAESPVHFANNTDFSVGTLTVTFNMPAGKANAELQLTLASGIEYMPGTVAATGGAISLKSGSTDANKPVFMIITASTGPVVTVTLKRKATKAVLSNSNIATGLYDKAELSIEGGPFGPDKKNNAPYQLPRPYLTIQQPEGTQNNASGTHTKTFTILNTGLGIIKDVYFAVTYPADVTSNGFWHNGVKLNSVEIEGKTLYKVPNANLAINQAVTITENYTVKKCEPSTRQIKYEAYWGTSNQIFEKSTPENKTLNIATGKPTINIDRDKNSSYFTWGEGLAGNKLGTFTVRYFNSGTGDNPTASKIKIKLFERHTGIFDSHKPENFRLVYTDGGVEKEIPILLPLLANQWLIKL